MIELHNARPRSGNQNAIVQRAEARRNGELARCEGRIVFVNDVDNTTRHYSSSTAEAVTTPFADAMLYPRPIFTCRAGPCTVPSSFTM